MLYVRKIIPIESILDKIYFMPPKFATYTRDQLIELNDPNNFNDDKNEEEEEEGSNKEIENQNQKQMMIK